AFGRRAGFALLAVGWVITLPPCAVGAGRQQARPSLFLAASANSQSHRWRDATRRDQSDVAWLAALLRLSEGAARLSEGAARRRSAGGAGVASSITACIAAVPTSLRAATAVSAEGSRSVMLTRLTTGESK